MRNFSTILTIKLFIFFNFIQFINSQVTWSVQTGYYTTSIIQQPSAQFAYWLKNNIENSLAQPRSGGFCDRTTPDFPLDSQILCGTKVKENICWKFEFTFKDAEAANYKLEVGGDFGRGMAMFVNGTPDVTIQSSVWWNLDFNDPGVLRLNFDFQAGINTITFYGGEDCCEGLQSMRFQRNNGGWRIFTKANVLDVMPFVCDHPCQKCSMDPTDCYTCEGDHRILSNGCICQDSYYEDSEDKICKQCVDNCAICPDIDHCTESVPGYFVDEDGITIVKCPNKFSTCNSLTEGTGCQGNNRQTTLPCLCNNSYYDDLVNPNCIICPLKFYKCSSPTVGIQCQGMGRSSIIPDCLCNLGYYEAPGNNQDCIKCQTNCKRCENGIECQECIDGFYLNDKNCVKCPNKFTKCSSATFGLECAVGTGRSSILPDCECLDTYFDDNSNSVNCQKCIHPCINCISSNQNCKTCVERDFINDFPYCTCQLGYFEIEISSNLVCNQCQSQCKSCIESNDNCETCINTDNRYLKPNCLCLPGFYENQNQQCVPCIYPCLNCISQTICLSCFNLENRNLPPIDTSSCSCKDGFYDNNSKCLECNYACELCIGQSNNCVQCSVDNRHGSLCKCNDGFYDNGQPDCKVCDYQCKTCITESDNCISCSDENRDLQNNCKCKEGYYENSQKQCQICEFPCQNCINQFVCITCIQTGYTQLDSLRQLPGCLCQIGYYQHPQTKNCQKCHSRCQECTFSPENCIKCKKIPGRIMEAPLCKCQENEYFTYLNEQTQIETCQLCGPSCLTCENANKCLTCINPRASGENCDLIKQQNNSNIKLSVNIDGKMQEKIESCKIQCQECEITVENCTSCAVGKFRTLQKPFCECQLGYYALNSTSDCQPCTSFCQNCKNEQICIECKPDLNRKLNQITGQCECQKGFKDFNGECIKCYTYGKQCLKVCPKNTVQNESLFICMDTKVKVENSKNIGILLVVACAIIGVMSVGKVLFSQILKLNLKSLTLKNQKQNRDSNLQQATSFSISDNSNLA